MQLVKLLIKKSGFYKPVRSLYRRISKIKQHPLQRIKNKSGLNFKSLGSENASWTFVDDAELYGSTIISAGLGEDASFDIEYAKKYRARVIIVDPTPRAIKHFTGITNNLGTKNLRNYSNGGKQPFDAYDLSELTSRNLTLVEKALWNTRTELKFFEPKNPNNVSHSISNYQNDYSNDTNYIKVEAIPLLELIEELNLESKDIPLIKLDIEGAEIEVIRDIIDKGFKPKQILVEFDELSLSSQKAYERIDEVHEKLVNNGYECVRTDGEADFLYLRMA